MPRVNGRTTDRPRLKGAKSPAQGTALEAEAVAQQGPEQAPLFRQETQPRLAVGGHAQVGRALVTVLDLQGAVPDRDGRLLLLAAGEGEVVDGGQVRGLPRLKREGQP